MAILGVSHLQSDSLDACMVSLLNVPNPLTSYVLDLSTTPSVAIARSLLITP